MMVRAEDVLPFEIVMHYWNDRGVLRAMEEGTKLRVFTHFIFDTDKCLLRSQSLRKNNDAILF